MGRTYRHQAVIDAPVEDVWAIVSDPRTHPEWWPDVVDVQLDEPLVEGGEYVRTSKPLPFVRRRGGGLGGRPARGPEGGALSLHADGHVGALLAHPGAGRRRSSRRESGMDPTKFRWRLMNNAFFLKDWIVKVLDALPKEVDARRLARRD